MKSAYELVMNRLEKETPMVKISEEQKNSLSQVDSEYSAKIAEQRLFLEDLIGKAKGNPAECDRLWAQLASEVARLEEEREAKKEKIRQRETKQG